MTWPSGGIATFATGIGGVTVAKLNAVRDALNTLGQAHVSWTPVVSSNATPPTMGASSIAGKMRLSGQTADLHVSVTLGAGFSAGVGAWTVSLPAGVTPIMGAASEALGYGIARQGTSRKPFVVEYSSATTVAMILTSSDSLLASGTPWAWGVGDRFSFVIPSMEII